MLRALACVLAALALASLVLIGVINAMAASRGEDAFGVLGVASFVVGVGTPACVGLFSDLAAGRGRSSPGFCWRARSRSAS